MATRKIKGRGAPGKAKSKAHREALSKALKAYHAKKGKGKSSARRKTAGARKASRTRTVGKRKSSRKTAYQKSEMRKVRNIKNRGVIRIKSEGGGYVTAPR